MIKTTNVMAIAGALVLGAASMAAAQNAVPGSAFIDINVGAQTGTKTVATSSSFSLYDETASVTTSQTIGSGPLFDFGGGYRIWKNLAVGLSFSTYSRTVSGSLSARIPDPVFYDKFANVTVQSPGLKRSEFGTHIRVVYFIPVNDKLDIAISGGPSFIRLSQDIPAGSVPSGQNLNVSVANQTATASGGNIGADVNYLIKPHYGAGFFMRYAGGTVDLQGVTGVKVGGFQVGVGARIRF